MKRLKTKKAINIVGGSFTSKGNEAMLLTLAGAIQSRLPHVDIFVRIPSEYFPDTRAAGLIPVSGDEPTSLMSRLLSKARMARMYYRCIYLDIGGYQFGDPWGEKYAWKKWQAVKHCVRFGNPVFFMAQTWGPFSSDSLREAVTKIINASTVAFARDKTSLKEIQKLVGVENPKVRFAHDVAWNFQGDDLAVGRRLIQDAGLSMKEKSITVCVIPNMRVYERSEGRGQDNAYIKTLGVIVRYLCSGHNACVILIGHQLRRNNPEVNDDRILCNYLLKSLEKSLPVIHIDKWLPAAQVKAVIGNCDLAISSRYHGLIAALSQGVPSIAIGWAHKYEELFSEFGMSSNLLSLSKTNEETFEDIDAIIRQLPQLRGLILAKLDTMKKSGREAIDDVLSRIGEKFGD